MFRDETTMSSPMFWDFPGPPEIEAWLGSQDDIAASRGLKQLEQLSWGIGHVGLPGARQQLPIVEFYVPVEPERIAILGLVAD